MADSTRNGARRRASSEVVSHPQESPATAKLNGELIDESRSTLEMPMLCYGVPRSQCWTGTSVTGSETWGSPFAAPGRPALRLRRSPRRPTPLHCSRPVRPAAARFVSPCAVFLSD